MLLCITMSTWVPAPTAKSAFNKSLCTRLLRKETKITSISLSAMPLDQSFRIPHHSFFPTYIPYFIPNRNHHHSFT